MSEQLGFDGVEVPVNKEKEYLEPGFHKLTVKEFSYEKEEEGKTPLIQLHFTKNGEDSLVEKLWLSGKPGKSGEPVIYTRLQELVYGLTGDKIEEKFDSYSYTKKEDDKPSINYKVTNPSQVVRFLNKKLSGKSSVFKVGGEEKDGKIFTKLTFSGFLYYTDRTGNVVKYTEERKFTDSEAKYAITKAKTDTPPNNAPVTNAADLDML